MQEFLPVRSIQGCGTLFVVRCQYDVRIHGIEPPGLSTIQFRLVSCKASSCRVTAQFVYGKGIAQGRVFVQRRVRFVVAIQQQWSTELFVKNMVGWWFLLGGGLL